jgi:hypothetical protein
MMETETHEDLETAERSREEQRERVPATGGHGPLWQRDYAVALSGSERTPEDVLQLLREDFPAYSPANMAEFTRPEGASGPLEVGDTMHVRITAAGHCGVRVLHLGPRSLTLATLDGHPETGRITFGAYRDEGGRLILRIRSRARISNPLRHIGYRFVGLPAQTRVWIVFLERLAAACGGLRLGDVVHSADHVSELLDDGPGGDTPTFDAVDLR